MIVSQGIHLVCIQAPAKISPILVECNVPDSRRIQATHDTRLNTVSEELADTAGVLYRREASQSPLSEETTLQSETLVRVFFQ
jgi:hypothetical protein